MLRTNQEWKVFIDKYRLSMYLFNKYETLILDYLTSSLKALINATFLYIISRQIEC